MESLDFKNTYWNYYLQIENDFFATSPYCAIDKCNNNSFSVKYSQLLLSICSEIDTVCKTICKEIDETFDLSQCGISDYIKILNKKYPTFSEEIVTIIGYKYRNIQPWKGINNSYIPNWWNVYNDVKHHRDAVKNNKNNYKYANQKNIIDALCALYALTEYWAAKNFAINKDEEQNSTMMGYKSKVLHLPKWNFYLSFMGQDEWFDTKRFLNYIESGK